PGAHETIQASERRVGFGGPCRGVVVPLVCHASCSFLRCRARVHRPCPPRGVCRPPTVGAQVTISTSKDVACQRGRSPVPAAGIRCCSLSGLAIARAVCRGGGGGGG